MRATWIPLGNRHLAAGQQQIAHINLVGSLHVLYPSKISSPIAHPADETARAGPLHHHIDSEPTVHGELHVHLVARHPQHRPHGAVDTQDRHVGSHRSLGVVQHQVSNPEVLGRVLPDHDCAHRFLRDRLAQPEQATQPPVLPAQRRHFVDRSSEPRILVSELVVVRLHVDQVHVVADHAGEPAGDRGGDILDRGRHPHDRAIDHAHVLGLADAGTQEEEGHRQQEHHNSNVAIAPKRPHSIAPSGVSR